MYVGSYNNSYYNSVYGSTVKSTFGAQKASSSQNSIQNWLSNNGYGSVDSALFGSSSMKYLTAIKDGASGIKDALSALTSSKTYSKKTAVSSDANIMTISKSASSTSKNSPQSISIDQLASGQVNKGADVRSASLAGNAGAGHKQFEIEADGQTYRFNIDVQAGDNNRAIQQKMANAINARDIGVTASVSSDSKTGTSSLSIAADGTGDSNANRFEIRDTKGDLVSQYGVDQVTQEAQDALYSIDGGAQRRSSSNEVYIGDGMTATFKEVGEVKINQATDPTKAMDAVNDLADAYNSIYEAAKNAEDPKAAKLFDQLLSAAKGAASDLSKVGIGFNEDGRMTVDDDQLKKAASDGSLEKAFNGGSSSITSFSNGLSRIASNIQYSPSTYQTQDNTSNSALSNLDNLMYSGIGTNSQQMQLNIMNILFKTSSGLMVNLYG